MLWGKIREAFSHGLLSHELLKKANRLGINIDLFYLVSEGNFSCSPEWLESFKDYELCVLNRDDMELIAPDHPWDSIDGLRVQSFNPFQFENAGFIAVIKLHSH